MNNYVRERNKLKIKMKKQIDKLHAIQLNLKNKIVMKSF